MLQDIWQSLTRWFLGLAACNDVTTKPPTEKNIRADPNPGMTLDYQEDSGEKDSDSKTEVNGPSPAKKTTVLILVAPANDLHQVLQSQLEFFGICWGQN